MNLPGDWSTDTVSVNGVELRYYRTGDGPPMVMAHGFYENGRCWEPLASDLADDYDVVTYDARGHGRSDAPPTGYEVDDRVADLTGLIDALDLRNPILLGHSMGGSTVAWTAATRPTLPRAVVMEDPAGMYGPPDVGPEERAEMVREEVRENAAQTVEELAEEYDDRSPEVARRLAKADLECRPEIANIARIGYPRLSEAFPDVTRPALVLKSDADPATRATDLDVADELENGRLVHVPGAGHCVFRDRYEAAYAELRTFLLRV